MKRHKKYRSTLEEKLVPAAIAQGAKYEPVRLPFQPAARFYIPDLVLPNGIVVEIKGWFRAADRAKMLKVKAAYPELDIRFVLASPDQPIAKGSKTLQYEWCAQHGFGWAKNEVPAVWFDDPSRDGALEILNKLPRRKVS